MFSINLKERVDERVNITFEMVAQTPDSFEVAVVSNRKHEKIISGEVEFEFFLSEKKSVVMDS